MNYQKKIKLENFNKFLESLGNISVDTEKTEETMIRTEISEINLGTRLIQAEIMYDIKNSFLYSIILDINQPEEKSKRFYEGLLNKELEKFEVFEVSIS